MKIYRKQKTGVALFIVITSIIILAFAMKELIIKSSSQVERTRNSMDRIQAIYLARSVFNLARFFILFDQQLEQGDPKDEAKDIWNQPIPFPVPIEMINALTATAQGEKAPELTSDQKDQMHQCQDFFKTFQGDAVANIKDLGSRINLNDVVVPEMQEILTRLLSPNYQFIDALGQRNIRPEEIVREIRDYVDTDTEEKETGAPEDEGYKSEYRTDGPKNQEMLTIDELKMLPSVDQEVFDYLNPLTTAVSFSGRTKPSKINLNTVSREVFQALLKNVSSPEQVADEFVKDRTENNRVYTDKNMQSQLKDLSLDNTNLPLNLLSGVSYGFEVRIRSKVNDVEIEMTSLVKKPEGKIDPRPSLQTRISP